MVWNNCSLRNCASTGRTASIGERSADGIACSFVDANYGEEHFFVRHAYFLGARPVQGAQDDGGGRDRPTCLGHSLERQIPAISQARLRPHRGKRSSTTWVTRQ